LPLPPPGHPPANLPGVSDILRVKKRQSFFKLCPNFDGLVKTLNTFFPVIPVKTGIQYFQKLGRFWIPAFE
jgi:hypothetical protein